MVGDTAQPGVRAPYPQAMDHDVALIVVTYNSATVVTDLLDSLPAALDGLVADVLVVDNGSHDGTADLLAQRPDCRVVRSTNRGYAAGINLGVEHAGAAPAVVVLNPDVRLDAGAVRRLLEPLARPQVGIVAPRVHAVDGSLHLSLRRTPTLARALGLSRTRIPALSEYVHEARAYEQPGPVDWALGAILAISRDCLDDVGAWDESFFLYSEETDFCLRASDRGWVTWYEPSATATHIGGASGQNDFTHTLQILNRVRLYRRRSGPVAGFCYYVLTILSEASWAIRGHHQSRTAIRALLRPSTRPVEAEWGEGLVPA